MAKKNNKQKTAENGTKQSLKTGDKKLAGPNRPST
ncbi:spore protein [Lentibacillus sediminis]|nr:spore protein [Lentibacillus sediminis]